MEQGKPISVNTYVQGSIWKWVQSGANQTGYRQGVQSSGRPVLIISNDRFNQHSHSLNCLTITSELKNSPVHVPIILDVESHIQCEQIHTIFKGELIEYKGTVAPITLSTVKAKLSYQFDMRTDRSLEMLTSIKNSVDELSSQAKDGFGVTGITAEMAGILINIQDCFSYIKTELTKIQPENRQSDMNQLHNANNSKTDNPIVVEKANQLGKPVNTNAEQKRKRGGYTDEEVAFILDTANPVDEIISRFGLKNKTKVYQMRSYHKRKNQKPESSPQVQSTKKISNKVKNKRRTYSDDEIKYIIDKNTPIGDIMTMFDYKDKATAYKMRAYFKKKYSDTVSST